MVILSKRWVSASVISLFMVFGVVVSLYLHSTRHQANELARRYFADRVTNCGSGIYAAEFVDYGFFSDDYIISQYKDISIAAEPDALTEADKMNGYEWKGKMTLSFKAIRRKTIPNNEKFMDIRKLVDIADKSGKSIEFRNWEDGDHIFEDLTERNGHWEVGSNRYRLHPPCRDLR